MDKLCRKCLLEDMDETDYFKRLKDYISAYPKEKRTGGEEYSRRLEVCRSCEELYSGMCRKCGCYVELRALKKEARCAAVPDKWQ
ncbi:hypothetical protein Osc1_03130 [Hominimerdicola sp. 21CYCFAH17_S]